MKLLYFLKDGNQPALGILCDKGILDIDALQVANAQPVFGDKPIDLNGLAYLKNLLNADSIDSRFYVDETSVSIASCCPSPSKIICIGLNYTQHAIESNMPIPANPVVFNKFSNTLINYQQNVSLGKVGEQFDYEVELGVVIGKKAKNVTKENALSHVLGYCVANDLSCRDLQFRSTQWLLGKTLDQFLPLGKYVLTADELPDPQVLDLTCWMNEELRQHANTSDMIFSVAEIIEDLSNHMTLMPGDLILTGTPFGVILGMQEKNWMKPGDIVRVEIEKLGFTENTMVE